MSGRPVENARGNFKEVQQVAFVFTEPDTSFRNNLHEAACLPLPLYYFSVYRTSGVIFFIDYCTAREELERRKKHFSKCTRMRPW